MDLLMEDLFKKEFNHICIWLYSLISISIDANLQYIYICGDKVSLALALAPSCAALRF